MEHKICRLRSDELVEKRHYRVAVKVSKYGTSKNGKLCCRASTIDFKKIKDLTRGDLIVFYSNGVIEPELFVCTGNSFMNEYGFMSAKTRQLPIDEIYVKDLNLLNKNINIFISNINHPKFK